MKDILFKSVIFASLMTSASAMAKTFNVMAPLVIGDLEDQESQESQDAWQEFANDLVSIKKLGADAVSTDVWWGVVEPENNNFNWSYYDKVYNYIKAAGLKWIPILSFHTCGGNVGDTCNIPIPGWVWSLSNPDDLMYKSEQGNQTREVVSVWGTQLIINEYRQLMEAFAAHFADAASDIVEINVSLGAAGELRYPSYNSHDTGAGYPTRGALQAYSPSAVKSFQTFAIEKYGDIESVATAWNIVGALSHESQILPPSNVQAFIDREDDYKTQYGRDFHTWYHQSLLNHGKLILTQAVEVFSNNLSPFKSSEIGAKIPGIHWLAGAKRRAELAAGLIQSSGDDLKDESQGMGYKSIISAIKSLESHPNNPKMVLHFTCLEMGDRENWDNAKSLAKSLVRWVGKEAHRQGIALKGENALAGGLYSDYGWNNIEEAIADYHYDGATFLRVFDITRNNAIGAERFEQLVKSYKK